MFVGTRTPELIWPIGPENPSLSPGEVHVWAAGLGVPPETTTDLVSEAEAERARRFHHEPDRIHYLARRATVRRLLGCYLGIEPRLVPLRAHPAGKPMLDLAQTTVHFSLSASASLGLFAFTTAGAIGVDLELIRPFPELDRAIEDQFTGREGVALNGLPPAERLRAFFRVWTMKEAMVKATGLGMADIRNVEVDLGNGSFVGLDPAQKSGLPEAFWHSALPEPAANFIGHVVVLGPVSAVRHWQI